MHAASSTLSTTDVASKLHGFRRQIWRFLAARRFNAVTREFIGRDMDADLLVSLPRVGPGTPFPTCVH